MPELPEITVIAEQMDREIKGKRIAKIEVRQPKNLNMPVQRFLKATVGKRIDAVSSRGKWIFIKLHPAHFMLINLGMGAEILLSKPRQKPPEKTQFILTFSDGTGFTIHFWWFGYVHLVPEEELSKHKMTSQLGISPLDENFTLECLKKLLAGKKTGIKSFLLDQKNIAGIGNVYVQDVLFKAKLHPNRKIQSLSAKEISALYSAIREVLHRSIRLGGAAFERNFYGQRGRFTLNKFLVGYKPERPCPECGTTIKKIRTGTTASYVCLTCQVEK